MPGDIASSEDADYDDGVLDTLHVLPLHLIPLETPGLRKARLIKNSRLEGVVELFHGEDTGSGQLPPAELRKLFTFTDETRQDVATVAALSRLSSYDVYSLRIALRKLGIAVEQHHSLTLSAAKTRELGEYMRAYTQPLVQYVYGSQDGQVESFEDVVGLFKAPEIDTARQNLKRLSEQLDIDLIDIPAFLEDYGDVYLSLAYYQSCLDELQPMMANCLETLEQIVGDSDLRRQPSVLATCKRTKPVIGRTAAGIDHVLDDFRDRTRNVWSDFSDSRFELMKTSIIDYQSRIGAALCALWVKLQAWDDRFPDAKTGSMRRRLDFIMSDLRIGIDRIPNLKPAEAKSRAAA